MARAAVVRHYRSGREHKADVVARLIEVKSLWRFAPCRPDPLPGANQCTKLRREVSGHRGDEIKKVTGELMVQRRREAGAEQFIQLTEGKY